MSTAILKKQLHKTIDEVTDNSILEAVYTILNKSLDDQFVLSPAQKKELDKRLRDHQKGKLSYFTPQQVKRNAYEQLKK